MNRLAKEGSTRQILQVVQGLENTNQCGNSGRIADDTVAIVHLNWRIVGKFAQVGTNNSLRLP